MVYGVYRLLSLAMQAAQTGINCKSELREKTYVGLSTGILVGVFASRVFQQGSKVSFVPAKQTTNKPPTTFSLCWNILIKQNEKFKSNRFAFVLVLVLSKERPNCKRFPLVRLCTREVWSLEFEVETC